ncbi:MAG: hypothetical protein MHM6MM_001920 [Cercozoa sp. M6MM]
MSQQSQEFVLSAQLATEGPLRVVAANPEGKIIVFGEQHGHLYRAIQSDEGKWVAQRIFPACLHGAQKLLLSLRAVPGTEDTFISGGTDQYARVWKAMTAQSLGLLQGHGGAVNSVFPIDSEHVVTGSFDGSARVFAGTRVAATLGGHRYGVEVALVGSGDSALIVTASEKHLHLWDQQGKCVHTEKNAHAHVIRAIAVHPQDAHCFVSCANDGALKLWQVNPATRTCQLKGETVAHAAVGDTPPFVYAAVFLSDQLVASAGEDSTVRVWDTTSWQCVQEIKHPGAVRNMCTLPNGDLVTACTDGVCRVFTRRTADAASAEEIAAFNEIVDACHAGKEQGGMEALDASEFPGVEALSQAGTKEGETRVINDPSQGGLQVYQWSQGQWQHLGSALGKSRGNAGNVLDGMEYDHVVQVQLGDKQVPLGFNKHEDPLAVARAFVAQHPHIDVGSVGEIAAHLSQFADPAARQQHLQQQQLQRAQMPRQLPAWKVGNYDIFAAARIEAMERAVTGVADAYQGEDKPQVQQAIASLLSLVAAQGSYHVCKDAETVDAAVAAAAPVLTIGTLPVLDMVRVMLCRDDCNLSLSRQISLLQEATTRSTAQGVQPFAALSLVAKTLANLLAKRQRTPQERQQGVPPAELLQFCVTLLQHMCAMLPRCQGKGHAAAAASVVAAVHNTTRWFGLLREGRSEDAQYDAVWTACVTLLRDVAVALGGHFAARTRFFWLVTVGTVGVVSPRIKDAMLQDETLCSRIRQQAAVSAQHASPASKEVAADMTRVFGIHYET